MPFELPALFSFERAYGFERQQLFVVFVPHQTSILTAKVYAVRPPAQANC